MCAIFWETAELTLEARTATSCHDRSEVCRTALTPALAGMECLQRRSQGCRFALAGAHNEGALDRPLATQIEVRRLPMPKRPSGAFCPIVRRLPPWVAQELAQLLEARLADPLLYSAQRGECRILRLEPPRQVARLCLLLRAPLAGLLAPHAVPLLQKVT